jgi:PAS domain-containing protein
MRSAILRWFRKWCASSVGFREPSSPLLSLAVIERDLAVLQAETMGAERFRGQFGWSVKGTELSSETKRLLRALVEEAPIPSLLVDPRPGLHIVDFNEPFAEATLSTHRRIAGEKLFTAFPGSPDKADASGLRSIFEGLTRCAQTGRVYARSETLRLDLWDASGVAVVRYWHPINIPIVDEDGRLLYVLAQPGPVQTERAG